MPMHTGKCDFWSFKPCVIERVCMLRAGGPEDNQDLDGVITDRIAAGHQDQYRHEAGYRQEAAI